MTQPDPAHPLDHARVLRDHAAILAAEQDGHALPGRRVPTPEQVLVALEVAAATLERPDDLPRTLQQIRTECSRRKCTANRIAQESGILEPDPGRPDEVFKPTRPVPVRLAPGSLARRVADVPVGELVDLLAGRFDACVGQALLDLMGAFQAAVQELDKDKTP